MAKKDNTLLIVGAVGLGAYFLLNRSGGNGGGQQAMFRLPDGRVVPESALPGLGYVRYQGQWYHYSALNQAGGQNTNQAQWQNWVNAGTTVLSSGIEIWQIFQNAFGNNNNAGNIDATGGELDGGWNDPYGPGDGQGGWA